MKPFRDITPSDAQGIAVCPRDIDDTITQEWKN